MSSCSSSGLHKSSEGTNGQDERPVSAENLLPEPTIASITNSKDASRLSSVLHGATLAPPSRLTRQQTFPPLQPYVRVRYMSTTGEIHTESTSPSSSSSASERSRTGGDQLKRESSDETCGDKGNKVAKLGREKENVDPRKELDIDISSLKNRRNILQVMKFKFAVKSMFIILG